NSGLKRLAMCTSPKLTLHYLQRDSVSITLARIIVLILSIDWVIGIIRAVSNLIGNCVATLVIGSWEKDVDVQQVQRMLNDPNWAKSELVQTPSQLKPIDEKSIIY
ncbi:hypothetical protein ACG907_05815, partial [Acinetobacter bereziniae]